MSFNNLSGDDRSEMQAFLAKLNGQEHRFALYDHSYTRRGAGTGTLSVNGANQSGASLFASLQVFQSRIISKPVIIYLLIMNFTWSRMTPVQTGQELSR
jgi:hypothetical protein